MKLDPDKQNWIKEPALVSIMKTIASHGGEARFVGGAVRDSLLRRAVQDVDLAVNMPPDVVSDILVKAGFKIVPIGIEHGTIMVVANKKSFEITSLRQDHQTDGRHAVVSFTTDWQQDAKRRDFTMNALYADASGEIYDYFDGLSDIKARHLRFIGRAQDRIDEDHLRILRYFRFLSQFGEPLLVDQEALAACRAKAKLIPTLSAERLWKELSCLLLGSAVGTTVSLMQENGIFASFLPQITDIGRFEDFLLLEKKHTTPNVVRRLACLLKKDHAATAVTLRLSRKEKEHLIGCSQILPVLRDVDTASVLRQYLYDTGKEIVTSALLILMAEGDREKETLFSTLDEWENPVFPLNGKNLLELGLSQGPEMGALLKSVETWWRGQDFRPLHKNCFEKAKSLVNADSQG
ncbi:MAG TPA: CCA tRNA nucleotidyltransferase [Rhodospirillaceae bacterium]|nr:CCA tRNA nucleotidyltransferase [Rhodospirillaceae bacterium]